LNFHRDVISGLLLEGLRGGDDAVVAVDVEQFGVFAGKGEPKFGVLVLVGVRN